MFNSSLNVRHAVRLAIAGAAAAASTAALAQQATTAASSTAAPKELEEVIVTGTRIQQSPNSVSIAPVASLTADDIAKTGLVRTEDLLNNLPQVIAEQGSGQSISADGTASVSLRGLGSYRTLVLINGRRMQPGGGIINASSPDINQIPSAMVERVDVLTGGASATYGADAVAGVVNFIMNTHFEGVRIDFDYGQNMYGQNSDTAQQALRDKGLPVPGNFTGGQNRDWSFMAGSNFADGKGNATVYATYLNTSPVVGTDLDYAGCTLNSAGAAPPPGQPWGKVTCGGSSSSATGRFLLLGNNGTSSYATLADGTIDAGNGQFRPYTAADSYNYGGISYAQRQAERWTAGAFLNYDVNENINVYSETMFARNTSTAQYGPSGLFAFGTPSISCSNPLLGDVNTPGTPAFNMCQPAEIAANQSTFGGTGDRITVYAARRSVESGPRLDNYSSDSIRQVIGMRGGWGDAWTYDVYGQYGMSLLHDNEGGFLGAQQVNYALDVVPNPATGGVAGVAAGAPVCVVALTGIDTACVPWNIWNRGGVNAAQLAYLTVASTYDVNATEYILDGSVTGDLGKYGIKFPTAATGVDVNIGTEYRQESYDFDPDYIFAHGFASGGNGAATAIHGKFHVNEYFVEARVPIVDNVPGIYHLGFEGGYRYSDYTTGFTTDTFKLGLEYAPIQDLKLRGSFNRAVRAPSIGDLYSPAPVGAGGTADPCWGIGASAPAFTVQQCINTGLPAAKYGHVLPNPAAQINTTAGGNPNLKPESADTYTIGFVLQPVALPAFTMSLDYYDIKIDDTITSLTSNTVLTNCANTGDPQLCGLIHRDPNTGSLWVNNNDYVDTDEVNIGTITTKGYDLAARYMQPVGSMGKLAFTLSGTYVTDWSTQPLPTGASYDCTGLYGATCNAPTPKWRHTFETDWATPWAGLTIAARWRYIGPVDVDSSSSDPQLNQDFQPGFGHIGGYDYIDLSAAISWGEHFSFRAGVNNITDKPPPIVLNGNYSNCPNTTCNDNTWVGTYDTLGRYLFLHVTAKF